MNDVIDSLLKTDFNKELKKVSIFERCNNLSNIYENNNKCIITNCNKNANYKCLLDNEHYCWYHTITWKDK
jgi:hypothetical protein